MQTNATLAFPKNIKPAREDRAIQNECMRLFREIVFRRDGYACQWCNSYRDITAHHIVPRSISNILGYYDPRNGMTLCEHCHLTLMTFKPKLYVEFRDAWLFRRRLSYQGLLLEFRKSVRRSDVDLIAICNKLTEKRKRDH